MSRYATGKYAKAISDRSGMEFPYREMVREWNGSFVHYTEYEPKQPQLKPAKNVIDAVALFQPRPDNDPTNIQINLQYGWFDNNLSYADVPQTLDSTQYRKPLFPTGHSAIGSVLIDFCQYWCLPLYHFLFEFFWLWNFWGSCYSSICLICGDFVLKPEAKLLE